MRARAEAVAALAPVVVAALTAVVLAALVAESALTEVVVLAAAALAVVVALTVVVLAAEPALTEAVALMAAALAEVAALTVVALAAEPALTAVALVAEALSALAVLLFWQGPLPAFDEAAEQEEAPVPAEFQLTLLPVREAVHCQPIVPVPLTVRLPAMLPFALRRRFVPFVP